MLTIPSVVVFFENYDRGKVTISEVFFRRFPRDGADDQFRATENQSIKIENPFIKTEENPFLVRLAQLDKEKPLR